MITISLCMIVKNEEAVLARCLDSVQDSVDEIIIVDTGSTDRTKDIARKYTEHIYDFTWIDDFSAARNFAYRKATKEYQMWLDADDILPEAERKKLITLKETLDPATDMVTMKYITHTDERGNPILTSVRERLTKRVKQFQWQDPVHECIPLVPNALHSDIEIWHKKPQPHTDEVSVRNLNIYEALERSGKEFTPRQMYYYARELKDHRFYNRAAEYFERFLRTGLGWYEDNIAACFSLASCYHELEKENRVLPVLTQSFQYSGPRSEICCEIGYYHMRRNDYQTALQWFQVATKLKQPDSLGFLLQDYWGYIPNIECCVCCCQLGQYEKALEYNRAAEQYKPDSASVTHNYQYLNHVFSAKSSQHLH